MNEEIETEETLDVETDAVEVDDSAGDVEAETVVVEPEPTPEPSVAKAPKRQKIVAVSGNAKDDVHLASCVYKNVYARKSLTIHHLQRVLVDLGYREAGSDKDGWYGDKTRLAVSQFQADNSIAGDGLMNGQTFSAIFAKDAYVNVILD